MLRIGLDSVAKQLHMTERTLRRKLHDEETSFRKIIDELRMHVAIKYLRDTDLTSRKSPILWDSARTQASVTRFDAGRRSRRSNFESAAAARCARV